MLKNGKSAQRGSFWDGHVADIWGSFARISRPKTSVRALEKNKHFGADVYDPKGFPKFFGQINFGLNSVLKMLWEGTRE